MHWHSLESEDLLRFCSPGASLSSSYFWPWPLQPGSQMQEEGRGSVPGSITSAVLSPAPPPWPRVQVRSPWRGTIPEKGWLAPSPPHRVILGSSKSGLLPASLLPSLSSTCMWALCIWEQLPSQSPAPRPHSGCMDRSGLFPNQLLKLKCCSWHPSQPEPPAPLLLWASSCEVPEETLARSLTSPGKGPGTGSPLMISVGLHVKSVQKGSLQPGQGERVINCVPSSLLKLTAMPQDENYTGFRVQQTRLSPRSACDWLDGLSQVT